MPTRARPGAGWPNAVVAALRDAGLFRLCVPASFGGVEAHPSELVDCVAAVAER